VLDHQPDPVAGRGPGQAGLGVVDGERVRQGLGHAGHADVVGEVGRISASPAFGGRSTSRSVANAGRISSRAHIFLTSRPL
jgi:hypothetical protein